MNEDKIKGQWKQLAGKLKTKWGKLTDDDVKITEMFRKSASDDHLGIPVRVEGETIHYAYPVAICAARRS